MTSIVDVAIAAILIAIGVIGWTVLAVAFASIAAYASDRKGGGG
jgi:hypothetical protein